MAHVECVANVIKWVDCWVAQKVNGCIENKTINNWVNLMKCSWDQQNFHFNEIDQWI